MFAGRQDEVGHDALVRIGYHSVRKFQTSVGPAKCLTASKKLLVWIVSGRDCG